MSARILFHRDFRGMTGGHLKVRDYFNHIIASREHDALIHFSERSVWNTSNPWSREKSRVTSEWSPEEADILFLAGMDWRMLTPAQQASPPRPVINLVQHVRHADPDQPLYEFLAHPAIRICVSSEVADAINATGRVKGPVRVIENGIDLERMKADRPWDDRHIDVLVIGGKQPAMARAIASSLAGLERLEVLDRFVPRDKLLQKLANTRIAVCLPHLTEGFYLPALEAMASGCLVVCPDCVGNRGFCTPDKTCVMPDNDPGAIADSVAVAASWSASHRERLRGNALQRARFFGIQQERERFYGVLAELDDLWSEAIS